MITFIQKGDFSKVTNFLEKSKEVFRIGLLDKYARMGVDALSKATPVDSGETAKSWGYEIENNKNTIRISFYNTNIQNGVNIALILQYGHATKNGHWVEGEDYINPAIKPVFDKIVEDLWKEVVK